LAKAEKVPDSSYAAMDERQRQYAKERAAYEEKQKAAAKPKADFQKTEPTKEPEAPKWASDTAREAQRKDEKAVGLKPGQSVTKETPAKKKVPVYEQKYGKYKKPATVYEVKQDATRLLSETIGENFKIADFKAGDKELFVQFPNRAAADRYEPKVAEIAKYMKVKFSTGTSFDISSRAEQAQDKKDRAEARQSTRKRNAGR